VSAWLAEAVLLVAVPELVEVGAVPEASLRAGLLIDAERPEELNVTLPTTEPLGAGEKLFHPWQLALPRGPTWSWQVYRSYVLEPAERDNFIVRSTCWSVPLVK
jgi:hypothetical protein